MDVVDGGDWTDDEIEFGGERKGGLEAEEEEEKEGEGFWGCH